jgi:hypothetical protein
LIVKAELINHFQKIFFLNGQSHKTYLFPEIS